MAVYITGVVSRLQHNLKYNLETKAFTKHIINTHKLKYMELDFIKKFKKYFSSQQHSCFTTTFNHRFIRHSLQHPSLLFYILLTLSHLSLWHDVSMISHFILFKRRIRHCTDAAARLASRRIRASIFQDLFLLL